MATSSSSSAVANQARLSAALPTDIASFGAPSERSRSVEPFASVAIRNTADTIAATATAAVGVSGRFGNNASNSSQLPSSSNNNIAVDSPMLRRLNYRNQHQLHLGSPPKSAPGLNYGISNKFRFTGEVTTIGDGGEGGSAALARRRLRSKSKP